MLPLYAFDCGLALGTVLSAFTFFIWARNSRRVR